MMFAWRRMRCISGRGNSIEAEEVARKAVTVCENPLATLLANDSGQDIDLLDHLGGIVRRPG